MIDSLYIAGPTASGKSGFACEICEAFPGRFEIISVDSVQVYKGLDIGSGKVSQELRDRYPHHLIDIVEPDVHFDVSLFMAEAKRAYTSIRSKGKIPLFVGGSHLYLDAWLSGLSKMPEANEDLRARLKDDAVEHGAAFLHKRLRCFDPESAARIHPHDVQRIIRAIEVYELTGETISSYRNRREGRWNSDSLLYVVEHERDDLYQRINNRVDQMMAEGFLAEVESLLGKGLGADAVSLQSIGYLQLLEYIDGRYSLDEAVSRIKKTTRKYAKKQLTWLKRYDYGVYCSLKEESRVIENINRKISEEQ